jgi:hypothetical protein
MGGRTADSRSKTGLFNAISPRFQKLGFEKFALPRPLVSKHRRTHATLYSPRNDGGIERHRNLLLGEAADFLLLQIVYYPL